MILTTLIFSPIAFAFLIFLFLKNGNSFFEKFFAICGITLPLLLFIFVSTRYDYLSSSFQLVESLNISKCSLFNMKIGVDYISLPLIGLTYFLLFTSALFITNLFSKDGLLKLSFALIVSSLSAAALASLDIILFYICFELILVPVFLLINAFGGESKVYTSFKFFLYTSAGSILMLIAFILIMMFSGSTLIVDVFDAGQRMPIKYQKIICLLLFLSAAIKMPLPPFHSWLRYAHVQSPTIGSVFLSGILIKLGAYVLIRFLIPVFPEIVSDFKSIPISLGAFAVIFGSMLSFMQDDMKQLVAFSSIAHMGSIVIGLFSMNEFGAIGAIFHMISHGVVSSALFIAIDCIYKNKKTRNISQLSSLSEDSPIFSVVFFLLCLSNIGFPGLPGFVGELLIIIGIAKYSKILSFIVIIGAFLSMGYMINMYINVFFKNSSSICIKKIEMLSIEKIGFFLILLCLIFLGILPNYLINSLAPSIHNILFLL